MMNGLESRSVDAGKGRQASKSVIVGLVVGFLVVRHAACFWVFDTLNDDIKLCSLIVGVMLWAALSEESGITYRIPPVFISVCVVYLYAVGLGVLNCREERDTSLDTGECLVVKIGEECASMFPQEEMFIHVSNTSALEERDIISKAWFETDLRTRLGSALELGTEFIAKLDFDVGLCVEAMDSLICKSFKYPACAADCTKLETCPDFLCQSNTANQCAKLLRDLYAAWGEQLDIFMTADEIRVTEMALEYMVSRMCPEESQEQSPVKHMHACIEWSGIHDERNLSPDEMLCSLEGIVSEKESKICTGYQIALDLGFSFIAGLLVVVKVLLIRGRFILFKTLRLDPFACFAYLAMLTLLVLAVRLRQFQPDPAWSLSSMICYSVAQFILFNLLVKLFNKQASRNASISLIGAIFKQLKPGGRLFVFRYLVMQLVEISIKLLDLETNIAPTTHFPGTVAFSVVICGNFLGIPVLFFQSHRVFLVFEILSDLTYVLLKYSFSNSAALGFTDTLALLTPLFSLAYLLVDVLDFWTQAAQESASIHPIGTSPGTSNQDKVARKISHVLRSVGLHKASSVAQVRDTHSSKTSTKVSVMFGIGAVACASSLPLSLLIRGVVQSRKCAEELSSCVWQGATPKVFFSDGMFSSSSCGLDHIKTLTANDCGLTELPDSLGAVRHLQTVDLRGNPLERFPGWLAAWLERCQEREGEEELCELQLDTLSTVSDVDWSKLGLKNPPTEILRFLPNIKVLNLSRNALKVFPPQLFSLCPNIQVLDMSHNQLHDIAPQSFSKASHLVDINLAQNQLRVLPTAVLEMMFEEKSEVTVHVANNPVSAIIHSMQSAHFHFHDDVAFLPELRALTIRGFGEKEHSNFNLTKEMFEKIPAEIENLVFVNLLQGTIPTEIGLLRKLRHIGLAGNLLSGTLPTQVGFLSDLTALGIFENLVSGPIPTELGGLASLSNVLLHSNQLSGQIPTELFMLSRLEHLLIYNNRLSGTIPTQVGMLSNLKHFNAGVNLLQGTVPSEFGLIEPLQNLVVGSNQLTGTIPTEIGQCLELQELGLHENQLEGSMPPQITSLLQLERLLLSHSNLSQSIPTELGQLTNLRVLELTDVGLFGELPPQLASLSKLEILLLDFNTLHSTIPDFVSSMESLRHLSLDGNSFTGTLSSSIGRLQNLKSLALNHNALSGTLPSQLGLLLNLEGLDLSSNTFQGTVPSELGKLTLLKVLRLESNNFSGTLPSEISQLPNLEDLNTSFPVSS